MGSGCDETKRCLRTDGKQSRRREEKKALEVGDDTVAKSFVILVDCEGKRFDAGWVALEFRGFFGSEAKAHCERRDAATEDVEQVAGRLGVVEDVTEPGL